MAQPQTPLEQRLGDYAEKATTTFKPNLSPKNLVWGWRYRSMAEKACMDAWSATSPQSPMRGNPEMTRKVIDTIDYLISEMTERGTWWEPKRRDWSGGDPNANRFALYPMFDAVLRIRGTDAGQKAWPRWRPHLKRAADFQRAVYHGEGPSWDWYHRSAGYYLNQDAMLLLVFALSDQLFGGKKYGDDAASIMAQIATQQLPGGAFHYIGVTNESPQYHRHNTICVAHYYTLSQDPVALEVLEKSGTYRKLSMTRDATFQGWTDVWWKQDWPKPWGEALAISAYFQTDPVLNHLLQTWVDKGGLKTLKPSMRTVFSAPYWPQSLTPQSFPRQYFAADLNSRGYQGCDGSWYYGTCKGGGVRNTFVGGVWQSTADAGHQHASFRGANIQVKRTKDDKHGLFLSQSNDNVKFATTTDAAAIDVSYRLQPRTINAYPRPKTPDTPWKVRQLWHTSPHGIVGGIHLTALETTEAHKIRGVIKLDKKWESLKPDRYRTAGLSLVVLDAFGFTTWEKDKHSTNLVFEMDVDKAVQAGDTWHYAIWIGPKGHPAPSELSWIDGEKAWLAQWPDGEQLAVISQNATSRTQQKLMKQMKKVTIHVGENAKGDARSAPAKIKRGDVAILQAVQN